MATFDPQDIAEVERCCELAGQPDQTMTALGILHAVAITPEVMMPSEWLPVIFGGGMPEFDGIGRAQEVMNGMMSVYNRYMSRFQNGSLTFPFDMAKLKTGDLEEIEAWAGGFDEGLRLRADIWLPGDPDRPLSEEDEDLYSSIAIVHAAANPDEVDNIFDHSKSEVAEIREKGHDPEDLLVSVFAILPKAVETLTELGMQLDQERISTTLPAREPVRSKKVGRNEPCPCGSGRKFKKCCGGSHGPGPVMVH